MAKMATLPKHGFMQYNGQIPAVHLQMVSEETHVIEEVLNAGHIHLLLL